MKEFFENLLSDPAKLTGFISAILVGLLALLNICLFFRPSARLKRAEMRKKFKEHKNSVESDKIRQNVNKIVKKEEKKLIKELGYKNCYKDDLIELSANKKQIKLCFQLDDDPNTSFEQELTEAYLHAAKMIENGKAKIIID